MANKGSGNLIYIKWDTNALVGLTDKSISFSADMLDITDQQSSGGWKEFTPGEKGGTVNFSGLYAEDATEGAVSAIADLTSGKLCVCKFGESVTGRIYWEFNGYIETIDINGPKNYPMSYSGTIRMTGKPTAKSTGF